MKISRNARVWILVCLLAACTSAERHERTNWYVATTGNDGNVCTESTDPCRTLAEVLGRADEDDKIILAAGTYNEMLPTTTEDGSEFRFTGSLWITGAGIGETILDMSSSTGLQIFSGVTQLDNFTIQNAASHCIWVSSLATIERVEATRCGSSGFRTTGMDPLTLRDVIASNNSDGAEVNSGELIIDGGQFSNNDIGIKSGGSSSLTVNGAIIENNAAMGIYTVGGSADLSNLTVTGNSRADGPIHSAVRLNGSSATITDSLIDANVMIGLGIFNDSSVLVEDSIISNNAREGIHVNGRGSQIDVTNVTISNNCSFYAGLAQPCAVTNREGIVAIRNSRITHNQTGGIWNNDRGVMSITETSIDENIGGFCTIQNEGEAVITNSLIANNTQYSGRPTLPAVCNFGDLSIHNTTISNNGHGVEVRGGELALSYITIAENDEFGLLMAGPVTDLVRRLDNVLIVKNGVADCIASYTISAFRIGGTNFDSDGTCPETFITRSPAQIFLDILADNGGPTLTRALLPGSPAIDAASSSCPENDQRLILRPIGAACDVGAYEAGAATTSLAATPTPSEIIALVLEDARCRTGPGLVYSDFDFFEPGQTTIVKGRSADSNWYFVEAISYEGNCWIGDAVLQFDVDSSILLALPIINPPPTPTPTLDPDESYDTTPTHTACPTLVNKPGSCK